MAEESYVFWLKTARAWSRDFQRLDTYNEPVPFHSSSILRTQIKSNSCEEPILTLTSTITDFALGKWQISMTKEQAAQLPINVGVSPLQVLYMETNVVTDISSVWPLMTAAVLYVQSGVSWINSSAYLNLFTSEHRNKPKLIEWARRNLNFAEDISNCADDVITAFELGTFVEGDQLDVIGQLVGVGRYLSFVPSDGRGTYLSDIDYLTVIKAKIIQNCWKGQIAELTALWELLFPGILIVIADNQDMTMTIYLAGGIDAFFQELVANGYIVPKPAGVGINYNYGYIPVFGYDVENDGYIAGYDVGYWADLR